MSRAVTRGITSRHARPVVGALAGALVAVVVIGFIILTAQTYRITSAIRESQQDNSSTRDLIIDCTTVGGDCFTAAQAESERAGRDRVDAVNAVVVAAAYCATAVPAPSVEEIEACVRDAVKETQGPSPVTP